MARFSKRCRTSYLGWWVVVLLGVALSACGSGSSGFDDPVTVAGRMTDGTLTSPIAQATCQFATSEGDVLAEDTTDDQGRFALDVPVDRVGSIECTPPGLPQLALSTLIDTQGVQAGETIPMDGQEAVSPATTLLNQRIGRRFTTNRDAIKQNYLLDIASLSVRIRRDNGRLAGFDVIDPQQVSEPAVGLSAFAATALYNAFFQLGIDADFQAAQQDLIARERVRARHLQTLGIPIEQAEVLARLLNASIDAAAVAFDLPAPSPPTDSATPIGATFAKARLRVQVVNPQG